MSIGFALYFEREGHLREVFSARTGLKKSLSVAQNTPTPFQATLFTTTRSEAQTEIVHWGGSLGTLWLRSRCASCSVSDSNSTTTLSNSLSPSILP